MAIDSVRLLADSAAGLWRRLSRFGPLDTLSSSASFDEWLAAPRPALDADDEQALRRDYRRLVTLLAELETLARSRQRALELVAATPPAPPAPDPGGALTPR